MVGGGYGCPVLILGEHREWINDSRALEGGLGSALRGPWTGSCPAMP